MTSLRAASGVRLCKRNCFLEVDLTFQQAEDIALSMESAAAKSKQLQPCKSKVHSGDLSSGQSQLLQMWEAKPWSHEMPILSHQGGVPKTTKNLTTPKRGAHTSISHEYNMFTLQELLHTLVIR